MKKTEKIKDLKLNKKMLFVVIVILLLASCIIPFGIQIIQRKTKNQDSLSFEYEIISNVLTEDNYEYEIFITVESAEGIEYIQYPDGDILETKGKTVVAIDYKIVNDVEYKFKIKEKDKEEKERIIYKKIPQIEGQYNLVNGVYVNIPDLTGFVKERTRYLSLDQNGNMIPGNWLTDSEPENWYSYKEQKWANIYIETKGIESYYVWIPRYCFKLDQEKQRSDVKFIDISNNYKDENGYLTTWAELKEQGYQVPEAFNWENDDGETYRIPGCWASKYTLGDFTTYTIDYNMISNITSITVKDINTNTTVAIAKYTYALNGKIKNESEIPVDYEFTDLNNGENVVNVTALDANGEIVGSMTKVYSPADVNEPDLTGFNPDTTFYVTWDANGIEYSHIPISQPAPEMWYEYGASVWANIVTRNNGVETYYTWIPRYEFILDQTSQRSTVKFISGTGNGTGGEYQVPEAFSWVDENGDTKQLTGYWVSKYTLGE